MRWWWGPFCSRPTRWVRFCCASSMKQQSWDWHVAPLGHLILIPSRPVFVLSPSCCVLSGEAKDTNFIVLDLTRPGLKPTIYHTPGEDANHYVTDAIQNKDVYDCNIRYIITTLYTTKISIQQKHSSMTFDECCA